jgi:hypothetical protein
MKKGMDFSRFILLIKVEKNNVFLKLLNGICMNEMKINLYEITLTWIGHAGSIFNTEDIRPKKPR